MQPLLAISILGYDCHYPCGFLSCASQSVPEARGKTVIFFMLKIQLVRNSAAEANLQHLLEVLAVCEILR